MKDLQEGPTPAPRFGPTFGPTFGDDPWSRFDRPTEEAGILDTADSGYATAVRWIRYTDTNPTGLELQVNGHWLRIIANADPRMVDQVRTALTKPELCRLFVVYHKQNHKVYELTLEGILNPASSD